MGLSLRLACLAAAAAPAAALLGVGAQDAASQIVELLRPSVSFTLDDPPASHAEPSWERSARQAAALRQLECAPTLLDDVEQMVGKAEGGDALAMAGLGTIYLFGQDCLRKRNLTWGVHWLRRAAQLGQPDAQATMGFLHASDVLRDLYNFTALEANRSHARVLYERAAAAGSAYAHMALGARHGAAPSSCGPAAAHYEQAAIRGVAALDELRRHSVEMSNPTDAEHLTTLSHQTSERERMDGGTVEYMDYCARIGDVTGKVSMAHLYHMGSHGVPRDREAARFWFRSAAKQGDGMGHANLGFMQLRQGQHAAAVKSLRRATKLRDISAWAGVGYAYLYGAGVQQSDELAAKAIWLAARQGHLDSIFNLGVLNLLGRGVSQNPRMGVRYLSAAAEYGQPQAQLYYGRLARAGLGVRKDCPTALFFLKHAADNAPLVRELMGVALRAYDQQRPQRALLYYLLAAHAGVEVAQQNAGFLYAYAPLPLRREWEEVYTQRALQYLKLAAHQGSKEALVLLGAVYERKRDFTTSHHLFEAAAAEGSRDAYWHVGMDYLHGRGVGRSVPKAIEMFKLAGAQSKFAQLRGVEALAFGVARFVYESRVALLFGAALLSILARGGNPVEMLQGVLGGGQCPLDGAPAEYEDEDDFDDFDEKE